MDLFRQLNAFLSRHLTHAVKRIFLINIGVFLLLQLLFIFSRGEGYRAGAGERLWGLLAEDPRLSLFRFQIWRFVTYMFVHVAGMHLLFNMMILWFFGPDLEMRWGRRRFWQFYLITGTGAGVIHALISVASGRELGPMIGASGALYGVLFAYATYYPNRMVLFWGIIPILIKYLVAIIILFDLIALGGSDGVSHVTHLAGLAVAFVYLSRYHHTTDLTRWRYMR